MPRYFVAIPLSDIVKDRLLAVQPPAAPGTRHLGHDEFHLTLHFLGEVDADEVDAVCKALATVRANAFAVTLRGIGAFPSEQHADVLWVGVDASVKLTALHHSIGIALTNAIGFRPESRPYSPHVTLARINQPGPPDLIEHYLEEKKGFMIPSVVLDHFALYSSSFADNVPKYQEEAIFPLLGSGAASNME